VLSNITLMILAQAPAEPNGTNPWLIVVVAVIAAIMGMGVVKLLDHLRKRDAEKEARQILEKAEITGQKLFERERHLDKQQDLVEQRAEQLQKQEKMV
jgi:ribonucrease Y